MKKLLILLICLSLAFCLVACGGNDNPPVNTDTNTGASTDTNTDTNVSNSKTYEIKITDQDGNPIANAVISVLDEFDNSLGTVTTNDLGVATYEDKTGLAYGFTTIELPEYHLNTNGLVQFTSANTYEIEVQNNRPNGTATRPYPIEDRFEFTLSGNGEIYYVLYGGSGRTFSVNCEEGLKLYYGQTEYAPNEDGVITFVIPEIDTSSRASILKFVNTGSAEITVSGTIESPLGSIDNPHVIEKENEEKDIVFLKGQTVYYTYTAKTNGYIMVASSSEGNDIYMQNLTTSVVSDSTAVSGTARIFAREGEVVRVIVASSADSNYQSVAFVLYETEGEGTESAPIIVDNNAYVTIDAGATAYFKVVNSGEVALSLTTVNTKGEGNFTLTLDGETLTPEEGDTNIAGIVVEIGETIIFTITNDGESAALILAYIEELQAVPLS